MLLHAAIVVTISIQCYFSKIDIDIGHKKLLSGKRGQPVSQPTSQPAIQLAS